MKRKSEEHIKELHPVGNGFTTFCDEVDMIARDSLLV